MFYSRTLKYLLIDYEHHLVIQQQSLSNCQITHHPSDLFELD